MKYSILRIAVFSLAFFSSAMAQEAIYRGVDAKGNTVYTNSPKGLQNARKIDVAPPVLIGTVPPSPQAAVPKPPAVRAASAPASAPASAERAEQAQSKLKAAQRAAESGQEPLLGERLGTAGGGARLAPVYFERQERLANELAQARAAFEAAGLVR